mgnify:CR=1 FL=1
MTPPDTVGHFSLQMMYDLIQETRDDVKAHNRDHKDDITRIESKIQETNETLTILVKTVDSLSQKIDCSKPQPPPQSEMGLIEFCGVTLRSKLAWLVGVIVAGIYGISQILPLIKKI